jgi:hypothetical protein
MHRGGGYLESCPAPMRIAPSGAFAIAAFLAALFDVSLMSRAETNL